MHLQTISNALPIFAAAGHFNYLRSSHLYLSRMSKLKNTHPSVYEQFLAGHYVSRRSDSFWSGVGSDLLIEQTLMRSAKKSGGITKKAKLQGRPESIVDQIHAAQWAQNDQICLFRYILITIDR